jgi:hypothetical protein
MGIGKSASARLSNSSSSCNVFYPRVFPTNCLTKPKVEHEARKVVDLIGHGLCLVSIN